MFGKRQRQAHIEAIERALAADAEARTALVDALAHIDARLDEGLVEHEKLQIETDATVQHLRATVVDTKADLAQAVEHLAMVCAMLSERIATERQERQVLVEAVTSLVRGRSVETSPPRGRVLGGTVYASPVEMSDATAVGNGNGSCWSPVTRAVGPQDAPPSNKQSLFGTRE